jgi:hypothetical protein
MSIVGELSFPLTFGSINCNSLNMSNLGKET